MCFFSWFSHAEKRFKFVEQVMFILVHSEIFHSFRSGHPLLFNNQTVLDCSNETKRVVATYYSSGTISKLKHTLLLDQSRLSHRSDRVKLPAVSPKINCLKFSKRAISFWLKIIISSTSCQLLDIFCEFSTLSSQSGCLKWHLSAMTLTYRPHTGKVNFDWSSGVKYNQQILSTNYDTALSTVSVSRIKL